MNETRIGKGTIMKRATVMVFLGLTCLMAMPAIAQARYRDGMNLYQYVGSAPVQEVDPMGLAGADIKFINYLVRKYGLSKAGREALHAELQVLKGAGGTAGKAAAEGAAASIARLGSKYVVRGLGVVFIVLTLDSTCGADDTLPPPSPEGIAQRIAAKERAQKAYMNECVAEQWEYRQRKSFEWKKRSAGIWPFYYKEVWSWELNYDWLWDQYYKRKLASKKMGDEKITRAECIKKCESLPHSGFSPVTSEEYPERPSDVSPFIRDPREKIFYRMKSLWSIAKDLDPKGHAHCSYRSFGDTTGVYW